MSFKGKSLKIRKATDKDRRAERSKELAERKSTRNQNRKKR
jgi:hypothetical protein